MTLLRREDKKEAVDFSLMGLKLASYRGNLRHCART